MLAMSWHTVNKCKIVYFSKKLANRTIVKANIKFQLNLKNIYRVTLLYKNTVVLVCAGFLFEVSTNVVPGAYIENGVLFPLF